MVAKRTWIALGLFVLTFLLLLAGTGVAMADAEPGALKGTFSVAEPRPGDRIVYSLAMLVEFPAMSEAVDDAFQYVPEGYNDPNQYGIPRPGQAFYIDAHARMVVARGDDRVLPSADGQSVATAAYETTWSVEDFAWDYGDFAGAGYESGGYRVAAQPWSVVHAIGRDVVAVTLPAASVGGDLPGRALAAELGVDAAGTVTTFQSAAGPCGFHSDLQGRKMELGKEVRVDGQCPPTAAIFGSHPETQPSVKVLASGHDDVGGRRATVFADVDGADKLRLWFAQDVPYPVRMLTMVTDYGDAMKVHLLYEMTQFQAGSGSPAQPAELPPTLGPRQPWGPDEWGNAHVFPLSSAWEAARADPEHGAFFSSHPDAQADSARFVHWEEADVTEERWTFTAISGNDARSFDVRQRTAPAGDGTLPPALAGLLPLQPETTIVVESQGVSAAGRTPPQRMPGEVPSVSALAARWSASNAGSPPAQSWAFRLCDDCDQSWAAAGEATSVEGSLRYSFLGLRADGQPAFLEESNGPYLVPGESSPDTYGAAGIPDDASDGDWSDPRGYGLAYAGFGVWTFPESETTATVGAAAAFLGLLTYFIYPFLKSVPGGVGAIGLFSRIGPDEVLDHPLRSQILALVEAEPGLHFQEMARRLDTGRGTLEHHLRKMVAADLLSAQPSQGFTCYFPKGKIDRRLMAAAPVLKSDGARLVLQAVANQPGRAAQDVAASTGLTPSTVNYHLKRLSGVGLVETIRRGRFTLLTPTSMGQQALGTWSGT